MSTLVDTNVLLDVFNDDPVWGDWSFGQLDRIAAVDDIIVNPVIYAELSVAFARIEALDAALDGIPARSVEIPRPALFLAGRVFRDYRRRRGTKTGVLPDFFIGAHAAVAGWALLTRDPSRYRTYFPSLELIAPPD